jgi:imidazolonepropionase
MDADLVVTRLSRLYTLDPGSQGLGERTDVSVAFAGGKLLYVGDPANAPEAPVTFDGRGCIGLPGLVDPHTHAVWAGSRSSEFARRLAGESYTAILEGGGGIRSTVRATREASTDVLVGSARARIEGMLEHGVTTVEVKSGYGLDPAQEARLLSVARSASARVRVVTTFLGAHAVPEELRGDRDAYVRQVIDEQLPWCAPLADCIDVYCDRGAFTLDEAVEILTAGRARGLHVRAHAEQVEHTGIAAAAAALGATSVDHLERIDDRGIAAMAANGTVAGLLPAAQVYLRDIAPPVARLREAGVPMAVGTDLNPGTSPVRDLWIAATLATLVQGLTIPEAVLGITRNAGRALGRADLGWLGEGSVADLSVFRPPPGEPPAVESLVQFLGDHRAALVVRDGQVVLR